MKKKRCFMAIAVSLVMTISFGSLSAFAAVHNIKDAKWYRQTASNWCWAAVSETMIDKETPNFTSNGFANRQARIVYAAHNNTNNTVGTSTDMIKAMKSISPTAFKNADWNNLTTSSHWKTIMNEILADDVVAIGLFNAKPPEFQTGSLKGHTTFAYWVDSSADNILLGDPWNSSNFIDVYKNDLMNTGIYCYEFPGVTVYGGTYVIY